MTQLNKPNYILDRTAGHDASLIDALNALVKAKHRIAFTHDELGEIPEVVVTKLKKLSFQQINFEIIQCLIFAMNALIDQVEQRQPARESSDYVELLCSDCESIYSTLDSIESLGLTLGRIIILLNGSERLVQSLEQIKQVLEAQESPRDILEAAL